jgi:LacI family transcriptional regulator
MVRALDSDERLAAKPATSFDVARLAGVSRSAVSRAFTPGASISAAARERVMEAAATLGYRVNHLARGLNKRRTDLVGLIASSMSNPYRAAQIDALAKCLVREGFRPMLFCIDEGMDTEQVISMLLNYSVSGVVITSNAPPAKICEECARMQVPLVLVDREDELPLVDRISGDNVKGGRLAADALIDAGRRRLVALRPKSDVYSIATRISAFVERAQAKGLEPEILPVGPPNYESGRDAAADIAARRSEGLGVFCPTDFIALGLLDALRTRHGVRIPEDASIVGYDDIPQAAWEFSNLTTIGQPVDQFAAETVALMKARIERPDSAPRRESVDVSLVRRGTV